MSIKFLRRINTRLVKKIQFNQGQTEYSIIVPVYNQESIILKNIQSILNCTEGSFELIVINDFSSDRTVDVITEFFENYININEHLRTVTIFNNRFWPLFETKCDNIGFKHAVGKYLLEIQADMEMIETGYNLQLSRPFQLSNQILAVSGRCAHNLFRKGGIGKLGFDIELSVSNLKLDRNIFYSFETCNRGPLLIDREKLCKLNYLNEKDFFLAFSDHDLMLRGYLKYSYICGYVPIDFRAPIEDGSTRKRKIKNLKDLLNFLEYNRLKFKNRNNWEKHPLRKKWHNLSPKIFYLA